MQCSLVGTYIKNLNYYTKLFSTNEMEYIPTFLYSFLTKVMEQLLKIIDGNNGLTPTQLYKDEISGLSTLEIYN